jgi:hypothetical protein
VGTRYTLSGIRRRGAGGLAPSADWCEAELLSEGFAANPTTLRALQQRCGFSNAEAADACGVALRTYRRWLHEGNPHPGAVRLLAVLGGYVPWDGWQGWEVDHGFLFPPGFSKGGILPGEFHALVFLRQLVTAYRQDNQRLRVRLAEVEAKAAQRQADPGPALHLV